MRNIPFPSMDAIKGEMDDTLTDSFWLRPSSRTLPGSSKKRNGFLFCRKKGVTLLFMAWRILFTFLHVFRASRHDILSTTKCTRKVPIL